MAAKDRTRKAIVDAFNQLIARKTFNSITVSMICETADIGKATFYRYFKDKYAVMNDNYAVLLQTCASDPSVHGYRDLFFLMLTQAHADFWNSVRNSFDSDGYNSLENFIAKHSFAFAEEVTKKNRGGRGLSDEERLQLEVFTTGIAAMFRSWTYPRYSLTPGQAADAIYACMPPDLRGCRLDL